MHYLVVAKVRDYLDVDKLISGLIRQTDILSNQDFENGKWENITDEFHAYWKNSYLYPKMALILFREYFANYGKEVHKESKKYTEEELCVKCDLFIKDHGLKIDDDHNVYTKVSGRFDYLLSGGRYDLGEDIKTAKYKDVVAKFGPIDVFVLPDFECRFTNRKGVEECPFENDDEVWVLDGYTYCNW